MVGILDVLLGHLEDGVTADRKEAAGAGSVRLGEEVDFGLGLSLGPADLAAAGGYPYYGPFGDDPVGCVGAWSLHPSLKPCRVLLDLADQLAALDPEAPS